MSDELSALQIENDRLIRLHRDLQYTCDALRADNVRLRTEITAIRRILEPES